MSTEVDAELLDDYIDDEEEYEDDEEYTEDARPDRMFQAKVFGVASVPVLIVDAVGHLGLPGLAIGGVAAIGAAAYSPAFREDIERAVHALTSLIPHREKKERRPGEWTIADRLAGKHLREQQTPVEVAGSGNEAAPDENIFTRAAALVTLPCRRVTMREIVANIERNSYVVCLGRSVTDDRHLAITASVVKTHLKLIGTSQMGKSSMAASILSSLIATHDTAHLQIAILDKEDQTGKLFTDCQHITSFRLETGEIVRMHARTNEQVLAYLRLMVQMMEYRYEMTRLQVAEQPLIVVYVEEFLSLKNHFKLLARQSKQAEADYASLIYYINELARRGLKARIQLLLCAQVQYRDEDFVEALANVTTGMCFSVPVSAAQAAGFMNAELLRQNRIANIPGQAVAEFPGFQDIVLAPDFDLEKRLQAYEKRRAHEGLDDTPSASTGAAAPASSAPETGSGLEVAEKRAEAVGSGDGHNGLSEREMAVLALLEAGASDSQIIKELWHTEGGGLFQKAATELQAIIVKLVRR